ncbi:hypothetical protein D9611_010139 [Ephemerocybe angulata]|uniref:BTB domain-containing protein n=1 Tax=Ephemerocybe angulata TaxID=980116 RepID=A0A8H5EVI4_9AGAR|nr:hypothetical protein D9611_010139 [Tulosesus angulatus]
MSARSADFYWENVVFKVEDTLFRVPRHGLENASIVFADMFRLPTGEGGQTAVEGQSDDNPIVLEGYTSSEFRSLLKILYPSATKVEPPWEGPEPCPYTTLSTTINLSKEEWIDILKLSTAWEMVVVRATAIAELISKDMTTPLDKVVLGRKFRIAAWLQEGLLGLVSQQPGSCASQGLETLGVALGWKSAARVVWIQKQLVSAAHVAIGEAIEFKADSIRCPECLGVVVKPGDICINCPNEVWVQESFYAAGRPVPQSQSDISQDYIAFLSGILCSRRHGWTGQTCPAKEGPKAENWTCMSCKTVLLRTDQVLIKGNIKRVGRIPGAEDPKVQIDAASYISTFFGDEVKSLQQSPGQDVT